MSISYLRRTAAAAAIAAGSLTLLGAPAQAQTPCYPPTPGCVTVPTTAPTTAPTLTLSATVVTRGQTLSASITGFRPGSSGILTIASVEQQIGTFVMPATGAATASITIPTNISLGAHTVFARGTLPNGQPGSASRGVTVVARGVGDDDDGGGGGGRGGTLARTGAVVIPTALVGVGLVLGGMALKRSSRRGKTSTSA